MVEMGTLSGSPDATQRERVDVWRQDPTCCVLIVELVKAEIVLEKRETERETETERDRERQRVRLLFRFLLCSAL
jgi:hypothetical protein